MQGRFPLRVPRWIAMLLSMFQLVGWPTIVTAAVALYGAILSTYNVVSDWKSKKRSVTVKTSRGLLLTPMPEQNPPLMLFLTATNPGFRPVTLTSLGFVFPNKFQGVIPNPFGDARLPHELKEGNHCTFWADPRDLAEKLRRNGFSGQIKLRAFFDDGLGVRHTSKKFRFDVNAELVGR
jgi:hypothetical protein